MENVGGRFANKPKKIASLPTRIVRESWRDVWFSFRKPAVIVISGNTIKIGKEDIPYWCLIAVQEILPSWFLPRWMDRRHLVLTFRLEGERHKASFVLRGRSSARARIMILRRAHRQFSHLLDFAVDQLKPLRTEVKDTYCLDRYVRFLKPSGSLRRILTEYVN